MVQELPAERDSNASHIDSTDQNIVARVTNLLKDKNLTVIKGSLKQTIGIQYFHF